MVNLVLSLRYCMRGLLREPSFALIVIVVLGLAIGSTATIFSVVDEVLFSGLPYREPNRLVMIWEANPAQPEPAGTHVPTARENFDRWRGDNQSFERIEAYRLGGFNLTGLRIPEHLDSAVSTSGLLSLFGVHPLLGRTFLPEDETTGGDQVVILSYKFYATHFAGSNPVGQKLLLDGVPYVVIGVLPKDFHLPNIMRGLLEYKPDVWVPLPPITASDPPIASKRRGLVAYARLKPDVSLARAQEQMKDLAMRLGKEDPALNSGYSANVYPLESENMAPDLRRALYILWVAVGLVLLLACTNVASLMVARGLAQQKDLAIMAALGAQRRDLLATVLVQGIILSVGGGVFGIAAAYGGLKAVAALKPAQIHSVERLAVNGHTFLFVGSLVLFASCLVGLIPAWLTGRRDLTDRLKQSRGVAIVGRSGSRSRSWLVVGEVAMAVTLATGATLLVRSFQCLLRVNPGFESQRVLTAHLVLPQSRYHDPAAQVQFSRRLLDDLRAIPRVQAASMIDNMPLYAIRYTTFEVEGRPVVNPGDASMADYASLTPDFFETMGIHMKSGRAFNAEDAEPDAAKVVILNGALARKLWPNEDAVGKHIRSLSTGTGPWATVVGVVDDFVQFNVASPARPEMFWPTKQFTSMSVAVRTKGDSAIASSDLQRAIWQIDKDQPVSDIQTVEEILRGSSSQPRFNMAALSTFAAIGILLAVIGVYGLITFLVSSRTRDIGVRYALGAQRKHVLLSLLRQSFPFVAVGLAIGLVLSIWSSQIMTRVVFGITALDPTTYVLALLGILVLMLIAVLVPALRAAKVSPAIVLRQE